MSHRNAPLSELGRLRLARCVVDEGWPLRRAAERFQVSATTASRWARREWLIARHGRTTAQSALRCALNGASSKSVWCGVGTCTDLLPARNPSGNGAPRVSPLRVGQAALARSTHRPRHPTDRARPLRRHRLHRREEARQDSRRGRSRMLGRSAGKRNSWHDKSSGKMNKYVARHRG
jgi:leucine-zipper of insertion element IS481